MLSLFETPSPTNAQRMLRLGIVLMMMALLGLSLVIPGIVHVGLDGHGVAFVGALSLLAIVGLGLLFRARFARWCGAAIFLLLGGLSIWQCGKLLVIVLPNAQWTLEFSLWVADSLASTLLLTWLNIRAIQILANSDRSASLLSSRITGVVLVIVGFAHIHLAFALGFVTSGYSFSISAEGIKLFGFPGWILWHSAAIPIGICLIGGWQRLLPVAALCLTVLVAILCPLLLVAIWDSTHPFGSAPLSLMALGGMVPLLFAYLCWWQAVELGVSWKTLDKRDLLFGLAALGVLVLAAAIYVSSQRPSMSRQDRFEAAMADFERADMPMRTERNRLAPPLDDAVIPTTDVWFCGSSSGETGNCDFYKENCEVLNAEPCQELKTAWCFTFQEGELGPDYFRCYAIESDCISARNYDASRCEQYPPT